MQQAEGLSIESEQKLANVHHDLVSLVKEVARVFPCLVLCGHRGEEEQNKAYAEGKSKLRFPQSNHNLSPSMAVDLSPLPYTEKNIERLIYFAGYVMGIASQMGLNVRWGGDWNRNQDSSDESFRDLYHFELRES